jgi:hypothetical protein
MAGDEDTGSEAKSPFGTPRASHREPPVISGEAVHVPDAEAGPAAKAHEGPSEAQAAGEAPAAEEPAIASDKAVSGTPEEALLHEETAEPMHATEPLSAIEPAPESEPTPKAEHVAGDMPPPPANMPPPAKPRGASPFAFLLTILVALGAGFAGAYAERQWFEGDNQPDLTPVEARLSAMDARLAASENKIAASENKIAANDKKLSAVASATPTDAGVTPDALAPLQARLSDVEASVKQALATAAAAQQQAAGHAEGGDIGEAQQQAIASAVAPPDLTPLQTQLDALEQKLNGLGALQKQVSGLEQHLAGLETLPPQVAQIDPIDQRLKQVEAVLNAPKIATRAAEEPVVKPDPRDANAPALAIIAETLVQKVTRGAPFAPETAALENLGFDKAKLADLQPAAAKGIVPAESLSKQFAALAPSLTAVREKEEGSMVERVMHHAAGLVRISRVDDLSGDDLQSRVARVQAALAHGDLDQALREWSALPEDAKTKSADWAATARASAQAIATAKAISADTIDRLTKLKS